MVQQVDQVAEQTVAAQLVRELRVRDMQVVQGLSTQLHMHHREAGEQVQLEAMQLVHLLLDQVVWVM